MATRRFCDICFLPLTPEDDKPLVRAFKYNEALPSETIIRTATAHVMIMNEQNHVLTDCCNGCKLKVVNEGIPTDKAVATLQPDAPPAITLLPLQPSIPPQTTTNPQPTTT